MDDASWCHASAFIYFHIYIAELQFTMHSAHNVTCLKLTSYSLTLDVFAQCDLHARRFHTVKKERKKRLLYIWPELMNDSGIVIQDIYSLFLQRRRALVCLKTFLTGLNVPQCEVVLFFLLLGDIFVNEICRQFASIDYANYLISWICTSLFTDGSHEAEVRQWNV